MLCLHPEAAGGEAWGLIELQPVHRGAAGGGFADDGGEIARPAEMIFPGLFSRMKQCHFLAGLGIGTGEMVAL
jgi:hypothetical protein